MPLVSPIYFEQKSNVDTNFSFPINLELLSQPVTSLGNEVPADISTKKKKKKTPTKTLSSGEVFIPADDNTQEEQYMDSYSETNSMLKNSVVQIDILQNDIKTELDQIKASKTLKKKYDYIGILSSTMSTLIGTKVTAIREMNKTITDCHNLDLKKAKDQSLIKENEQNDDKTIQDMYNAFISTPVGAAPPMAMPSMTDLTLMAGVPNVVRSDYGDSNASFNNYMSNLSPTDNMMLLEGTNAKTVVVYNESDGTRYFDVMDLSTGQSVPNTSKPDPMFMENLTLDVRGGIARDTQLNITYPLIVVGQNPALNMY